MPKGRREKSSTMVGIFTRSRAEIFLHRTRSGRARPDPAGRKRHHLIPTPPTAATAGASAPDEALGSDIHISIKDLRARRVFSPASISTECFPDQTGKIEVCIDRMDVIDASDEGIVYQSKDNVVEALPGSEAHADEEQAQSTPPDLELLRKLDEGRVTVAAEFDAESKDRGLKISGDDQTNVTSRYPEPGSSNPSKNRLGIVPCSRLKLYRNPSSFAYKRLMPYLMDLVKDRSSGVEILHCDNYPVKVEKNMEERALLLNEDPFTKQKDHTVGSKDSPTVKSDGNHDVENSGSENPTVRPREDLLDDPTVTQSPDPCSEGVVQVHTITNETPPGSYDSEYELMLNSSCCLPTNLGALSVEELTGDVPALSCFPRKVEEGSRTLLPTLEIDRMPALGASQLGSFGPLRNRALAPKKGILKRQTRGCLGLCMCLDCASFRVHAERAYEFSRKQMQEADEVVMRLMKELSCLRNIVEKSVVPVDDGAKNYTILQHNQEQVKGVCRRAFRVEELAKNRMKQMIHELNIHCRIPGSRVTFAECVEERCIP